ncbi:MAG: hemolysin family protein [Acidimicrobiales bacterium]|jgi:CBS domain containing-hemolysin-like protein
MSTGVAMLVAALLLITNGFFVAVEFGLIATQRAQLEDKANEGNKRARTALAAITDLNTQIAGAQLGITMCSIALGLVAEPSVAKLLEKTVLSGLGEGARHTVGLIIALSFVTFLHILIGEMVPKNIALADAPRTSMALAPIHATFVRIARPLVWLLNALANLVLRALGVTALDERASAKTPEELAKLLEEARDGRVLDGYDFTLLSNTLELGGASIENAVVPLAKVATAPSSASVAEIERRMAASGHSRLALTGHSGNLIGWVHAKDLLSVDDKIWSEPLPAHRKRQLILVDHRMAVEDALEMLQANRQHFALAMADGKAIGIITLEDVLKVLVSGLAGAQDRLPGLNTGRR